jgi:hypothetical protein
VLIAYKRIFVSIKVATTMKFFTGDPTRSFEAFDFRVRLLLPAFQFFEFSFVIRERFEKHFHQGTQRSISFGGLDSRSAINFIWK